MALGDYLQFVLALVFVLALILAVAWIFKRYGRGTVNAPRRASHGRRRLAIVEAISLDPRRKLVLVRRDGHEHLLIIGNQGETVVETGIVIPDDETVPATAKAGDVGGKQGRVGASFLRLVRQSARETS